MQGHPNQMHDQIVGGRYHVVRLLGEGGMGAVYEARHTDTGRRVALKVIVTEALAQGSGIVERFQREAKASGSIDSKHVVAVLDAGIDEATRSPFMVMEYLQGEDVHQFVSRVGILAPELALRIVAQACLGLQQAHEAGIVHRDIKSANMFLSRRDGSEVVLKLLDFGIAKVRPNPYAIGEDKRLTRTGTMLGSPLYMSPEQARGTKDLDGRSDIWSLGIVLYELLSGATPNGHRESIGELILAICAEPTLPLQNRAPWVSPQIAALVHKALSIEPDGRFQSAAEMYAAIAALLPEGTAIHESMLVPISSAMRSSRGARQKPRGSSLRWVLPLIGASALAGGLALYRTPPPDAIETDLPPAARAQSTAGTATSAGTAVSSAGTASSAQVSVATATPRPNPPAMPAAVVRPTRTTLTPDAAVAPPAPLPPQAKAAGAIVEKPPF